MKGSSRARCDGLARRRRLREKLKANRSFKAFAQREGWGETGLVDSIREELRALAKFADTDCANGESSSGYPRDGIEDMAPSHCCRFWDFQHGAGLTEA